MLVTYTFLILILKFAIKLHDFVAWILPWRFLTFLSWIKSRLWSWQKSPVKHLERPWMNLVPDFKMPRKNVLTQSRILFTCFEFRHRWYANVNGSQSQTIELYGFVIVQIFYKFVRDFQKLWMKLVRLDVNKQFIEWMNKLTVRLMKNLG